MKIWKAELILNYNFEDKWQTKFYFEPQEEDYKVNEKFNEWTYFKNWVGYRIPMKMLIENCSYSGLKAIQGFDHELNKDELIQLEKNMKSFMRKQLDCKKEEYLKQYENKLKAIGI
ncbi:TPA: hypothetical protein N2D16_002784 [Clostridium botulinum]|nr:hypothetical protein [Clostridium sporogenes]HCL4447179.1 hypothetical protein [Clostridium botulinum]